MTITITWLVCSLIVLLSLAAAVQRQTTSRSGQTVGALTRLAPAAVISIGIFGTFLGIYLGLRNFDTANINDSIPSLLVVCI